jgi:hypothetical protein
MIVWVVEVGDDDSSVEGVFSTREKGEAFVREKMRTDPVLWPRNMFRVAYYPVGAVVFYERPESGARDDVVCGWTWAAVSPHDGWRFARVFPYEVDGGRRCETCDNCSPQDGDPFRRLYCDELATHSMTLDDVCSRWAPVGAGAAEDAAMLAERTP